MKKHEREETVHACKRPGATVWDRAAEIGAFLGTGIVGGQRGAA